MARRNDPNDDAGLRKKRAQEQEQEQEKDTEQSHEKEGLSQQNQYGNQAIAGMLGMGSPAPGSGGVSAMPSIRTASDKDAGEIQYGGDEDGDDDTPITIEELTKNWRPKTTKKDDTLRFIESMPDDELPREDPEFIAKLNQSRAKTATGKHSGIDGLLEPSPTLMSSSLSRWCHGLRLWIPQQSLHEVVHASISPPAPFLQDRSSRILHSRARCSAIGTWLLLQSPILQGEAATQNALFIDYCMELYGRNYRLQNILKEIEDSQTRIPKCTSIFTANVGDQTGNHQATDLCADASAQVRFILHEMLAFRDASVFVPNLNSAQEDPDDDEDPLDIDSILAAHTTSNLPSETKQRYAQGLKSAEKLAQLVTHTRVRLAVACILISEVSQLWLKGAPNETLYSITQSVDKQTEDILRMLVEIAQATKQETIPPHGIQNGLTRAARAITTLRQRIVQTLTLVTGSALPMPPMFSHQYTPSNSPLAEAIADGTPLTALSWVKAQPDPFTRSVCEVLLRGISGASPATLFPEFERLFDTSPTDHPQSEWLQNMLDIYLGVCALRSNALDAALDSANRQYRVARRRHNGLLTAQATLLGMEALHRQGKTEQADAYRMQGALDCWTYGSRSGLTLLARWQPEEG